MSLTMAGSLVTVLVVAVARCTNCLFICKSVEEEESVEEEDGEKETTDSFRDNTLSYNLLVVSTIKTENDKDKKSNNNKPSFLTPV